MQNLPATAQVREVERDHVRERKQPSDLGDAGVVRSVAPTDEHRLLVEPEHVAAVCGRGRLHPAGDRDARRRERGDQRLRLACAARLADLSRIAPVGPISTGS